MGDLLENSKESATQFVGAVLRGQGWVELRGFFTLDRLKAIIQEIEKKNAGLEKKKPNDDQVGHRD